jgi:ABC-type methionine transport system permease subunit
MQILQFILDMTTSIPFIFLYIMGYPCRGELYAWVIANFAGFSLLALFMRFYNATYTPTSNTHREARKND